MGLNVSPDIVKPYECDLKFKLNSLYPVCYALISKGLRCPRSHQHTPYQVPHSHSVFSGYRCEGHTDHDNESF